MTVEAGTYSISQAARNSGLSEDELRCAIREGTLRASVQTNGDLAIAFSDFEQFLCHRGVLQSPRPWRVLIVDDEINFAKVLNTEFNRDPRIECRFVTWGRDCLEMLKSYIPHVILLDLLLPDTQAPQLRDEIRARDGLNDSRVLIYSAHLQVVRDQPDFEESMSRRGASGVLDKGKGMRQIVQRVYELLGVELPIRTGRP